MITAKNIKKRYTDFSLDLNFEIPKGYVTGLIGKNGAGKSTTIKLILGLVRPDEGRITVMDCNATDLSAKEKEEIGVTLAESGFSPYLRISDIISILKKSYLSFDAHKFEKECNRMHLPFDKPVKEFSTGMKAKLKVLVAMTHNAKLLIMDEPTAGLDVEARNEVLDLIREYMEEDENRTVLITSHISSDLESICDDIYLIDNGKVILHEDTDVILGEYGILKVDEEMYSNIDKQYLMKTVKTGYGYSCFTNQKRYYKENYPGIVIENAKLDELILMLAGGMNK
ncbi:MAG: ABC transporter ATP-binding protein [Firmicutes bacterium]|nr:ABC transporter ATP-binding protein [Bacillota bacterium]